MATTDKRPVPVQIIEPGGGLGQLGLPQLIEYRHLLRYFAQRAIRARYRPTAFGYGWIVLRPALLCAVYVFVFSVLIGLKSDPVPFPLFAFLGIVVFLFFASGITDAAASLTGNAGTMKKVYYARLVVPLSSMLVNLLDLAVALGLVFLLMLAYGFLPALAILLAPLFLLGIVVLTFGIGLLLAAYTVRSRDLMIVLPVAMRVIIYTMPAVYPVSLVPPAFLGAYFANPMAAFLQGLRWSLTGDPLPPLWSLLLAGALAMLALWRGLVAFNRVERTMVDTL